ncbi:small acid-soluble spore protein I (minor) [Thermoanaerobacterium sp. RBIITD]|nr:small acid-soluble spore protein I (minor) [Thermoanaerobacterium sp. RBIITD]
MYNMIGGINLDIRRIILDNLKNRSKEEIKGFIQDAVDSKEENAIPGLGIIFEASWEKMNDTEKNNMMDYVMRGIS